MKKCRLYFMGLLIFAVMILTGCNACANNSSEAKDQATVAKQQGIYQDVQPVHIYDYSIPRDIYQQIYDVTTTQVVATYSVIESITGLTRYECPSMGYAIPADVSLTNPLQGTYNFDSVGVDEFSQVIEQAEPNGLFSSKNTDATWVMCVELGSGEVYPIYVEHKVMTFPFIMEKNKKDQWVRADNKPIAFKIEIKNGNQGGKPPKVN
ncbi:hypothetical protein HOE31_00295 [bacterium]|jgi:hypothetical protein|nr:hypothetical protein [bacterium]MBT4495606.1 hypothetical protein [bacterium]MBT4764086.1 hypothetical protein [bacterium]MBT5401458.1 hypothetical protein [bacterium]MBT7336762.1 hypothetical protein [bacterium]